MILPVILLSDIADVRDDFKKDSTLTYVDGNASLSLEVMKTSDGNTVQVAKKVREEVWRQPVKRLWKLILWPKRH